MSKLCRAPGCSGAVTMGRFSVHCEKHHRALRRHGDTSGNAFTKTELANYRRMVKAKRKATKAAPFWTECETRWDELVRWAQSTVSAWRAGRATHRPTKIAAQEIIKVADASPAKEVIEVIGGMLLGLELDAHRFVSDRHFTFQLARRIRSLGDTLTATRWDNKHGKVRRLYHELTPRAVEVLAERLVEALGGAGVNIARTIKEDLRREQEKHNAYLASFQTIRGDAA
jgi:hypothetical protein